MSRHMPKYYPQYPADVDSFEQWEDEASEQKQPNLEPFPSNISADGEENSMYSDVISRHPQLVREGLFHRKLNALIRDREKSGAGIMKRRGDNSRVRNLGMGF